ncbi:MAG: hypothetical protein ACM3IL_01955, partial [Deltaproteobacteria bacterium]
NEKIKVLISEQLTYFKENQDFFRIYFSAREGIRWTIKDKLSASVVNKLMQYIDFIAGLIEKAQEEKIIRKDFEAKHLAFVLSSIMNTVIMGWFRPEPSKKEDLDDATTFVLDIFLSGARRKT